MTRERMHVVTVSFPDGMSTARVQNAYEEEGGAYLMPSGSWRRIETDPPTVEIAVVLDGEVPFETELTNLKQALADYVSPDFNILNVGEEEDHRDLDPCFA